MSVSLDLRSCKNPTDSAVQALASGLGQATSVSLNFYRCRNLTDSGKALLRSDGGARSMMKAQIRFERPSD